MTPEVVRAWILLSIPKQGGGLTAIMWTADGINKAIPERAELSDSLGWLRAAGLIEVAGSSYQRSVAGDDLMARCELDVEYIFDVWDKATELLAQVELSEYEPVSISETDFKIAHAKYQQEFWQLYKQLEQRDEQ